MGRVDQPNHVLLVLGAFSRHDGALEWARLRTAQCWSPIISASRHFAFVETEYYASSMGVGLQKQFFAYERLVDPDRLAALKRTTNLWEAEYAAAHDHAEPRPLNLDPGYMTEAKLVLASTKDFAHRIYLGQGIYAEVTLQYKHGDWQPFPWTFPDYRRADYHAFFSECREYLRERLQQQQQQNPAHP